MKIGTLDLGCQPLFLAPMDEITDPSFRSLCKHFGADMMYTEFVSSDGLVHNAASTFSKLKIYDHERPIGIQLYGHQIDAMVAATHIAAALHPDVIDINFGCPMKKIANRGAGSGMMREPQKMVEMTRQIVAAAASIPVTAKTRLGWDDDSKNIETIAEQLQDVGIAALTIHGRTRAQMYKGTADWTLIAAVKNNPRMHIPIIGNGDVHSPEDAKTMFDRYGVDGIMIGRSSIGRPWIFEHTKTYLQTGELLPSPNVQERVAVAQLHLQKSLEYKQGMHSIYEMRRHFCNYFKHLDNFKPTRLRLLTAETPDAIKEILNEIAVVWG
ncbi:tRNA-dihydrouridine synthase [Bacteroidia bacterium]|nr:tRNA-dihydrouridine synthase [Bacteroidia bacterium]